MDTLNTRQRALKDAINDLLTAECAADPEISVGDVVIVLQYAGNEATEYFSDCQQRELYPEPGDDDDGSTMGRRA